MASKAPEEGILTRVGTLTSRPTAFVIVGIYAVAMAILAPDEITWHSVATLATWLMTLFIQRAEHRDTQALHLKLDELLRAQPGAQSDLARVDEKEPEVIERDRKAHQQANL